MGRFVEVADQQQAGFLPACLEDYVDADNPVRIIDAFVDKLDLTELSFARVQLHRPEDLAKHRAP
ncbi:MAG: IS5/IS1182 family transposase, partial [Candidatus Devosia symbiotica]|nr:IS5/IS1182 family transposase [Candidatus Devosia symbiotica]